MATVEYDDISLNITSKLDAKGIDKAVDSLEKATDQVEEFAKAVDSVDGNKIPQYIQDIAKKATSRWKKASTPDWEMDWNRETTWKDSLTPVEDATRSMQNYMKATEESTADAYNELKAYLELYPKTKDSYLKDQMGFDTDTIAHVRQDMYMTAEDAKRAAEGMREFGNETKKTLTPMEKLANRFKSFLQYRAMRAVWSAFVNGAKEGVKNLENWDRNIGMTGFAESLDKARASLTILKNSLAVIVAPGLELISSVLQRIATWAMAAANAISRFFAILGGKSSYRAVKWGASLADSQTKAGSAAKKTTEEFKKQLMGFDEINNITAQNGGGSGGGGGGGIGGGFGDMFEDIPLDDLSNFEKTLQKVGEKVREWNTAFLGANQHIDETADKFNKFFHIDGLVAKAQQGLANFNKAVIDAMQSASRTILSEQEKIQEKSDNFNKGIKTAWDTTWGGIKTLLSGIASFVGSQFLKIKADIEFATTAASLMWDVLSGKKTLAEFKQGMEDAQKKLEAAKSSADNLYISLDKTFNRRWYVRTEWDEIINRTVHVNEIYTAIGSKGMRTVEKYASGGMMINSGQLFIAREAGPEMVGTIGGQSAVVNNQQIVDAVSQGVASAVASVMGNGSNVTVTLEGDAKGIFKVVQKEGRAYSARTGQPALA